MSKTIIFTVLIVTLFFIAKAEHEPCRVNIYDPDPEPICEKFYDENGKQEERCYGAGSGPTFVFLEDRDPTYKNGNFILEELYFHGSCECTLKLWVGANFKGKSKSYKFSQSSDNHILPTDVWKET